MTAYEQSQLKDLAYSLVEGSHAVDPYDEEAFLAGCINFFYDLQIYYTKEEPDCLVGLQKCATRLLENDVVDKHACLKEFLLKTSKLLVAPDLEVLTNEWSSESIAKAVSRIPGMLYPDTMKYYKWLARNFSHGGQIIEFGCWFGLSTNCLAEGLKESSVCESQRMLVVDSFIWKQWMEIHAGTHSEVLSSLQDGDSFMDLFLKNSPNISGMTVLQRSIDQGTSTELKSIIGLAQQTVDIAVIDVADDMQTILCCWELLLPWLQANRSIIVFNQYGNSKAFDVREFCGSNKNLRPVHKPIGSAKGFLFV